MVCVPSSYHSSFECSTDDYTRRYIC
jgi:hypothetical protein